MIPGANLLGEAFGLIAQQVVLYRQFNGRTKNDNFEYISSFTAPFELESSVQRVPRQIYKDFDLDFQRNYVNIFAMEDMLDLERDQAGDQFIYNFRVYQLESQGTWFAQDGWAKAMGIDIGPCAYDADGNPTFPDIV